jgi:DNA repair protein RecN (Recombination protein N)
MLISLSVQNFILIRKLNLDFSEGLNVITGETGAGKSIFLDAILFVLGGKYDNKIITPGADKATVTAEFSPKGEALEYLQQHEIDYSETILIKRVIDKNNRKKFFINDSPTTTNFVKQLTELMIEINAQNTHNKLHSPGTHIDILDEYAGLGSLRAEVGELVKEYNDLKQQKTKLEREYEQLTREAEYLDSSIKEIEELNIGESEVEELTNKRSELKAKKRQLESLKEAKNNLDEAGAIEKKAFKAQELLSRLDANKTEGDEEFGSIINSLEAATTNLQEANSALEAYLYNLGEDGMNLDEVEERLITIKDIARKHGTAPEELNDRLEVLKSNYREISEKLEFSSEIDNKITEKSKQLQDKCDKLSDSRDKAARSLESEIQNELPHLNLAGAVFKVDNQAKTIEQAGPKGADEVIFQASTNPGMPLSPISRIASGGELSRFLLAMKIALQQAYYSPTIIFDEIDVGLGGATAEAVGKRLKHLAGNSQIFTITHQPQVAASGDCHLLVKKNHFENETVSDIDILSREERTKEIARMISGARITEESKQAASSLLSEFNN